MAASKGSLPKKLGIVIKESLKSLEYRGYDSVGYAVITGDGELVLRKSKGMIDAVSEKLGFDLIDGLIGIGHTRWATHGPPSDINSHPHLDCTGRIAVAHNGIIENWRELKEWLLKRGHIFRSETDTEVIPHLIEEYKRRGYSPYNAFKEAVRRLRGTYAIVALDIGEPDKVFIAKKTSPLIIGFGRGVNFVGSDIPAFLRYTREVLVLRDGEVGYVSSDKVVVERELRGKGNDVEWVEVNYRERVRVVEWTPEMAMKSGYPHFMLKEIHEQPIAIASTLSGIKESIKDIAGVLERANRVILVGAGTSYHASYLGAIFLSNIGGVPSSALISSEAGWYKNSISEGDVVIAVSQSGETIDTLLAVREARRRGAYVISLSNVIDSAIPRESDYAFYTRAGPEIGVAATKTFTTQVTALAMLSVRIGRRRGILSEHEEVEHLKALSNLPSTVKTVLNLYEGRAKTISKVMKDKSNAFFLGRGYGLGLSMEGALKLKEIAYIHAEAYPAGESKHGPIAMIEEGFPVIFTAIDGYECDLIKSNVEEMRARYAWLLAIGPKEGLGIFGKVDEAIPMPSLPITAASVAYIIPHQLIAYYTSVAKGLDPDKPRNLAKTVTVV